MRSAIIVGAVLSLALLPHRVDADWDHACRKNCKILPKYTATAQAGCYNNRNLSYKYKDTGCGYAEASVSTTCGTGLGGASTKVRQDGSGFHVLINTHTGMGFNGPGNPHAFSDGHHAESSGDMSFDGTVDFDEMSHQVVATITDFFMTASKEKATFNVLDVILWVPANPSADDEVITPAQTIWSGRVLLQGGVATTSGDFPPGSLAVSEDDSSITLTAASVVLTMPVPLSVDLEDVVLKTHGDQGSGPLPDAPLPPLNPRCPAAKAKCLANRVRSILGCHQKAEKTNTPVDPACLAKAEAKYATCMAKAELRPTCVTTGDATALSGAMDAYVVDVVQEIDPFYPAPIANRCAVCKKKAVAAKTAAKLRCHAKALSHATPVDPGCLVKAEAKFAAAWSKCEAQVLCFTSGDEAALEAKVDAYVADTETALTDPLCGNGVIDPGEDCDPGGGAATSCPTVSNTSGFFGCSKTCQCACPTRVEYAALATDPATIVDAGWTGIAHRLPIPANGDVSAALTCAATSRPCGTCTLGGPIANHDADSGQLNTQRCSGDTSVRCTNAPGGSGGPCTGLGTCEHFLGSNLPVSAGGVAVCVTSRFAGPLTGTVDVESGETASNADVSSRVYTGITNDNPCPRCVGDSLDNDGVKAGACSGGLHPGAACDGNGAVPGRPDFGTMSLDCPPNSTLVATLPVDLTASTDVVTKTLSAASPSCSAAPGKRCLCDTCNDAAAEPCASDLDCPDPPGPSGAICGGLRCIGGANNGVPCTAASECPGGLCSRPGAGTKPSACVDDTAIAGDGTLCDDTAPVGDGEGECPEGPLVQSCSAASGHPQRSCTGDGDCGGGVGSCQVANRACFLDQGLLGGAIVAVGMEDPPVADESEPTLASVLCVGATGSLVVDGTVGLPGPSRVTTHGTAHGRP